jgi:hypothetical protein
MRPYVLVVRIWDGITWIHCCFDRSTDFAETAFLSDEQVGAHTWRDIKEMIGIILLFDGQQFGIMSTEEGVLPIWLLCPGLVGSAPGLSKLVFYLLH